MRTAVAAAAQRTSGATARPPPWPTAQSPRRKTRSSPSQTRPGAVRQARTTCSGCRAWESGGWRRCPPHRWGARPAAWNLFGLGAAGWKREREAEAGRGCGARRASASSRCKWRPLAAVPFGHVRRGCLRKSLLDLRQRRRRERQGDGELKSPVATQHSAAPEMRPTVRRAIWAAPSEGASVSGILLLVSAAAWGSDEWPRRRAALAAAAAVAHALLPRLRCSSRAGSRQAGCGASPPSSALPSCLETPVWEPAVWARERRLAWVGMAWWGWHGALLAWATRLAGAVGAVLARQRAAELLNGTQAKVEARSNAGGV